MKKFIATLLATAMVIGLVGCTSAGNTNNTTANNETTTVANDADATLGTQLSNLFLAEIANSTDLEAVANTLSTAAEMDCVVMPVSEGFLNGFSEEITGFSTGYMFSPMIGAIAFVGYVFEVEDAEAFKANLLSVADPRWNICTEAAETVCVTSGNYVFFTMCPGDEEEW